MIIAIEGIDGSGKTTLCKWLSQFYITTKEPGSPHVLVCIVIEKIIRFLFRLHLSFLTTPLFYLDHFFHYKYFLSRYPDWVIVCDRYLPISRRVYGKRLWLKRFLKDPDYVIYLRVSAPMAAARCRVKGENVRVSRLKKLLRRYDQVLYEYQFPFYWRTAVIDADNHFAYVSQEAEEIIRNWISESREEANEIGN